MGDKSTKSKERSENQKEVAKVSAAREAKSKQDRQGQAQKPPTTKA